MKGQNAQSEFIFPKEVKGWLDIEEGSLLYQLAKRNKGMGCVVELGSYHGRSTICLAQAVKVADGGRLYAIDNFLGDRYTRISNRFFTAFMKNIQKYQVDQWIKPIKGDFVKIATTWDKPIRLLFIDGAHSYKDAKRDFDSWERHVVEGGIVAFHDSLYWPGVTQFVKEVMQFGRFQDCNTLKSGAGLTYMIKAKSTESVSSEEVTSNMRTFNSLVRKRLLVRFIAGLREKVIRSH